MSKKESGRQKAMRGVVSDSHKGIGSHGRPKRAKGRNTPMHIRRGY